MTGKTPPARHNGGIILNVIFDRESLGLGGGAWFPYSCLSLKGSATPLARGEEMGKKRIQMYGSAR